MKYGRQIIVAPQPKTVDKLHLIDKTIARLAKEMDDVQRAKISADEKWRLMKYKLGNYLDLVTQVKQPYLRNKESDDDDDDDEDSVRLEPIRVKQEEEPRTSLKVNPFSPQKKKRPSPSSSKKKTTRPSYNLRMRNWQPMYK